MNNYSNETSEGVKKLLEDITAECKNLEGEFDRKLKIVREGQAQPSVIAELEEKLKLIKASNAETINGLKARYKKALEREKEQIEAENAEINARAGKEKASIKENMLAAWIKSGGSTDDFETSWPKLYQEEIERRTKNSVVMARNEFVDLIRSI